MATILGSIFAPSLTGDRAFKDLSTDPLGEGRRYVLRGELPWFATHIRRSETVTVKREEKYDVTYGTNFLGDRVEKEYKTRMVDVPVAVSHWCKITPEMTAFHDEIENSLNERFAQQIARGSVRICRSRYVKLNRADYKSTVARPPGTPISATLMIRETNPTMRTTRIGLEWIGHVTGDAPSVTDGEAASAAEAAAAAAAAAASAAAAAAAASVPVPTVETPVTV